MTNELIGLDLVAVIEQKAGIWLKRSSNHYRKGAEYNGPCPFCGGGRDRFHVWPDAETPHYWCRVCLKHGSAVRFLVEYCSMSYHQAQQALGLALRSASGWTKYAPRSANPRAMPPPALWQEQGNIWAHIAQRALWGSSAGREMLNYLRGRGLSDETIQQARLGYIPTRKDGKLHREPYELWGIDTGKLSPEQINRGIAVPSGLLIPWFEGQRLWRLSIRSLEGEIRYRQVMGSSEGLYNLDTITASRPIMLVEGEIDALSVMQVAGDLLACVATGSASRGRIGRWTELLSSVPLVLLSFDADAAGDQGTRYWQGQLPLSRRWQPWPDKDPNALLMSGRNGPALLRYWVETGLRDSR